MSKTLEICDRVYAVGGSGLSGPEDACVYLVDAASELVLIDTGAGLSIDRIEKNIRSAGFEPAQIWHIVATHCHIDHIGGLAQLVQRYSSKVILIKGEAEKLQLGDLVFNFIHTPGHTPGSISPYIDTKDGRVLFGQDIHGPFSQSWGSDLAMWRKSMEKLLALNADVLCEGHAGVYKGDKVGKYIEGYLKRYRA